MSRLRTATPIVLNVGLGEAIQNIKLLEAAQKELPQIAGQKAVITKAKKAIAGFKLRKGVPIGCKVTLRGDRMYEFLDKLISTSLPRIRDFKGVSGKSFDGHGNYTMGVKEQYIFPEVDYEKVEMVHGLDMVICTNAHSDESSKALLACMDGNTPIAKMYERVVATVPAASREIARQELRRIFDFLPPAGYLYILEPGSHGTKLPEYRRSEYRG